jgi:hypothetical protein
MSTNLTFLGDSTSLTSNKTLFDDPVSGSSPTSSEKIGFQEALGEKTCTNNIIARSVELFVLSVVATLLFLFFQLSGVESWFKRHIPDNNYRLVAKALLFFVLIYILDRIVVRIRDEIDICDFTDF